MDFHQKPKKKAHRKFLFTSAFPPEEQLSKKYNTTKEGFLGTSTN